MSMHLPLLTIAKLLGCDVSSDAVVTGAVIDSRQITTGTLFVALAGEQVDGHDYLAAARKAGASAALVSRAVDDALPQLLVPDVATAFAQIAMYWRGKCDTQVVAITGSNGKTSVKEMVASILRQCGTVVATQGNLNNELGVPLTLCRLSQDTDYAVIEMGANHAGEIARLVTMAMPQVALINNVASAHLEGFGSVEGVAVAKGEIFSGLSAEGVGIFNADMAFTSLWHSLLVGKQTLTFGLEHPADVHAEDVQIGTSGSHFMAKVEDEFHYLALPLVGRHNVANALAAVAVSTALAVPISAIETGLATVQGAPHRLQICQGLHGGVVIDDSYNANPGSFTQALAALQGFNAPHWLVLGDFGELGDDAEAIHATLGNEAKAAGISRLFTVGKDSEYASQAFGADATHVADKAALAAILKTELTTGITLLIKGSRFMALDTLAAMLTIGEK